MSGLYELDYTRSHPNGHVEIIAILTGLPDEEIVASAPVELSWYPRNYIETFRKLGFNVSPRFKKFDPKCKYPCMMRFSRTDIKENHWYAYAYYDEKVYTGSGVWCGFKEFYECNPDIKITSMLEVWI